jgi:RNA polymerase sigma-70 factor (ECF subfamily)
MEQVDLGLAADRSGTADVWGEAWSKLERAEILSAMESLPPEQREAIELGFFGGLSHVEVAEETGEPLGTIKGRMRLGLRRLRTVLEGRGMEPAG